VEEVPVQTYEDLVELARICWKQAHWTTSLDAAAELKRMAKEYQQRAAQLNGGKLADIGENES